MTPIQREPVQRLMDNLSQTIVGKQSAIQLVLSALLSGGHVLLEDVPGVGKTLLAKSLARSIGGLFKRVQCTPDLLPADITGTNIWNPRTGQFEFLAGPALTNILLADEINRATPRTQSALLEVMEEYQVTIDGISHPVPRPFFVIATQNPIEYQGTFPLPEAQMDRFAVSLNLGYPSQDEELVLLQQLNQRQSASIKPCISLQEINQLQVAAQQVRLETHLQTYLLALVRATREREDVRLGVSPRGGIALYRTTQAFAFLEGRDYALPDDVKRLAPHVLAHRLIPDAGQTGLQIVEDLLQSIPIP
ncbi:MAG: MoxR family ATPase [Elainellaceae cyanobacterium]